MIVTCPKCGRRAAVAEGARDVACPCGQRFDPFVRPTIADPFLDQEIGGYRIEAVIGSGGMGTVYRATQLSLGRSVAFKALPAHVSEDPTFVRRFHREAQVLASLSHPNVVQVIDRGEEQGRYFIVMEYIEGESLRDLMKRGPVPARQAYRIAAGLLAALDFAHERGIVHRDIKPENILISKDGVVKVADFGLSRVLGGDDPATRLTHTHLILGTYEYMAPEQREASGEADARADIYATAVVFYEMLTGGLPIGRFELPGEKVPGVDRRVDRILERGLAKDPKQRYERASAMGREIDSLLTEPEAPVDLEGLRRAAGGFARRVHGGVRGIFRRHPDGPRPPVSFEMHLDLLLTILAVCGVLLVVIGFGLLIAQEDARIGLLDLDDGFAGILVLIFGIFLWNSAERARKHWPGARTMLLALTVLAAASIVAIPVTIWTWVVLLHPKMRVFMDARHRGMDAPDAAALAQGMPLERKDRPQMTARLKAAVKANRSVMVAVGALAVATLIAWFFVGVGGGKATRDEGAALLGIGLSLTAIQMFFLYLMLTLPSGRITRLNAIVWSLLSPLSPKAARRAWMLVRDERDARKVL
jgi:predicted Ser/Thr protein kinase